MATPLDEKRILTFIILICFTGRIHAQCTGNLLTNGSFTSVEGEAITAPGWTGTSTPDINDENGPLNTTPGYVWTGTPLASPDGGTWQNLFGNEAVDQTVNVIPGTSYTFCFQYTAQGIIAGTFGFVGPVGIKVFINNVLSFTAPDDITQFTWETACYTFTPTTSSVNILMTPTDQFYIGVDGACLLPTVSSSILENSSGVNIYSNLVKDKFEISMSNNVLSEITLYDAGSRKIMQQKFNSTVSLNTASLERGIYFYELKNKEGMIRKGKFMKE